MTNNMQWNHCSMDISDDDVLEAMKTINGFLDITPGDFREIYVHAYRHSFERLKRMYGDFVYGAIRSPLAQPRNLIGGQIISAIIGVTAYKLFGGQMWLASALAVATAIAVMHATQTLHPPV